MILQNGQKKNERKIERNDITGQKEKEREVHEENREEMLKTERWSTRENICVCHSLRHGYEHLKLEKAKEKNERHKRDKQKKKEKKKKRRKRK